MTTKKSEMFPLIFNSHLKIENLEKPANSRLNARPPFNPLKRHKSLVQRI